MDFTFTPEQEVYRGKLRASLEKNSAEAFGRKGDGPSSSTANQLDVLDDRRWSQLLDYHRRLYRDGIVALHWPKEWGGGGASMIEQAIYQDEALRLGLPLYGANQLAIDRIGPTLMHLGTEEQKKRHLHKMLTGEQIWCQGYSEPNAGSDLAGLQTRAVLDGDTFVVNGQKVWTSLAHRADWQVLLVRTDPSAPKHKGISYLLVDMHSPGITVRPLVQITGDAGFNEVFYDNVRVPKENLVGELNAGWQVSIATLMYERVSGGTRHPVERTIGELIDLAKTVEFQGVPATSHPYVRQKLAQFATEGRCLRLSRYRSLTSQLKGKLPGVESSFGKLFGSELNLRVAMFADEMLGPYGALAPGSLGAVEGGRWMNRTLAARAFTIAAGSSEIQHNIIGERVLKLPKG
ncbi:MAG: acyl-CoA dehydrogenase family protein [Candidatus Binatus sp.]|uniref:acyl-CoA dehydrogenase family protein n=1 Tax=Candidatus Binatus sp. TaxID=2811406 RepID=UPI002718C55D|nr:acyl-CoA dehydrogenase family protein [Candidatus Binatus sp.]MDO8431209.1 acyl-CoA dehydrogenase family protein [Candidatus Binatus sp.]